MNFPNWNWSLMAVSVSFHGVAILSTIFRLWYRWYTARMWWDDAWVALAFLADIAFLVASVLQQPVPNDSLPLFFTVGNWIISFAYPILMWGARLSILTSMVRVSQPQGTLRHIAVGVGVFFGIMGIAMFGVRIQLCIIDAGLMTKDALISQIITDCIGDALLSALPVRFLRSVKLSRGRRILITSALSASIVIDIVTVIQAVIFFQFVSSGLIVLEHVKVACSMMVCNLLVIVTFIYRVLHKGKRGIEDSIHETNKIEFTTIDLAQGGYSHEMSMGQSLPIPSGASKSSTWSFRGN